MRHSEEASRICNGRRPAHTLSCNTLITETRVLHPRSRSAMLITIDMIRRTWIVKLDFVNRSACRLPPCTQEAVSRSSTRVLVEDLPYSMSDSPKGQINRHTPLGWLGKLFKILALLVTRKWWNGWRRIFPGVLLYQRPPRPYQVIRMGFPACKK